MNAHKSFIHVVCKHESAFLSKQVRSTLLSLQNDANIPGHMILACFLVQEGADIHIKNKRGHSPMYLCPPDMQTLMLNFVNKSRYSR